MGTPQLGIVSVVMVVRALPNAAGAEDENPKDSHQDGGGAGLGQDRLMLLVVINNEQTENEQSGKKTADDLADPMKIPKRPREGNRQEKRRGKNVPPAPHRGIRRVRLGCQYKFFACSHDRSIVTISVRIPSFVDSESVTVKNMHEEAMGCIWGVHPIPGEFKKTLWIDDEFAAAVGSANVLFYAGEHVC
jgi:hypothetical protein